MKPHILSHILKTFDQVMLTSSDPVEIYRPRCVATRAGIPFKAL